MDPKQVLFWFSAIATQAVQAQVPWYEIAPVIEVSAPQNTNCMQALELNYSVAYQYSEVDGECCQWFYVMPSQDDYQGATVQLFAPEGGTFSAFYTPYYQPCSAVGNCSSMEILPLSSGMVVNGVQYYEHQLPVYNGVSAGYYYIVYHPAMDQCVSGTLYFHFARTWMDSHSTCEECIPPFSPELGKVYMVNAWTKEELAPLNTTNFTAPRLRLMNLDISDNVITTEDIAPSGPIIDGWQRLEGTFTMNASAAQFKIELITLAGPVVFDDIRIFPADGSMKCYVYDPDNLRFVAELDERHFATFYEYDAEGKLVRVKKETERGIKTVQETRQNANHQ